MGEKKTISGDLWLIMQEGGFAADAIEVSDMRLADWVRTKFGPGTMSPMGDTHIGRVTITIERIDDETEAE